MTTSYPPRPAAPWQVPPPRPAGVPVYVDTSNPIITRYGAYPSMVEFSPGWRIALAPKQRHQFLLPPAVYHAKFFTWYFGIRVGKAEAVIDTRAGHPVYLAYAAPYTIWTRGLAGYPPLKRPGLAAIFVIIGIAFAVPLLAVLLGVLLR